MRHFERRRRRPLATMVSPNFHTLSKTEFAQLFGVQRMVPHSADLQVHNDVPRLGLVNLADAAINTLCGCRAFEFFDDHRSVANTDTCFAPNKQGRWCMAPSVDGARAGPLAITLFGAKHGGHRHRQCASTLPSFCRQMGCVTAVDFDRDSRSDGLV